MKILMLGWELPPHNSGGLGIACYQLCKALAKRHIDIEFILPYQADHGLKFMNVTSATATKVTDLLTSGAAYESRKYMASDGSLRNLTIHEHQAIYEKSVARLAEQREFDIVHAHDWLTFRAALRVKELRGCPIILHVHSVESDRAGNGPGNPMVREIEELGMTMADRIIAISEHTKKAIMRDYQIPASKIEVIHNSIDTGEIENVEVDNAYKYLTLMKRLGYKVVVNIGRLTIQKGLPNLLKAAQLVIDKEPKTLFLFVGSGEQHHELIEQAAELGIGSNVLFADFQRGKRWRDAFAIGDLFVMPSVSEPFGLTPLEAIGYSTPVLISKQSGVCEVLKNCLKVDFWDTKEMANKIITVTRNDVLRDELWLNSYQELQHMSWNEASQKVEQLYQSQLNGNDHE